MSNNASNMEAILQQLQQQRQQKQVKWSDKIKELMKEINDSKPKDRLDYALEFTRIFHALAFSLSGWGQWLGFAVKAQGMPQLASYAGFRRLTLAECQALYPQLKALALELLKLDYELSIAKEKEAVEEQAEEKKKTKSKKKTKKSQKKTAYIT